MKTSRVKNNTDSLISNINIDNVNLDSLNSLFDFNPFQFSLKKPKEWIEDNIVLGNKHLIQGKLNYDHTPYMKEIVNLTSCEYSLAKFVAVMKGAQIGCSASLIFPSLCYYIANEPTNVWLSIGNKELIRGASTKLDIYLRDAGLTDRLMPEVLKKRNSATGDTITSKEFSGGSLKLSSANNHKEIRQDPFKIIIADDFEAVTNETERSGDTLAMMRQRQVSYGHKAKFFAISTPEYLGTSNIYPAFLMGDQRYYNVRCPHCHNHIALKWKHNVGENLTAGINYEVDNLGSVIEKSVCYVCQICSKSFTDKNKRKLLNEGAEWIPTATPYAKHYYSYHISALYAPAHMAGWYHYACDHALANPNNQPVNKAKMKSFTNLCLGEPWKEEEVNISSELINKNRSAYEIGKIPNTLSLKHGNGEILFLTIGVDLNGVIRENSSTKMDDARVDYEIVGWTEDKVSYSIMHGSIGTFKPMMGQEAIYREGKMSYEHGVENSVWNVLEEIVMRDYVTDDGVVMNIYAGAIDHGPYTKHVEKYVVESMFNWHLVKGNGEAVRDNGTKQLFSSSKPVGAKRLWNVKVNYYKDILTEYMQVEWDEQNDKKQRHGYMNYPVGTNELYSNKNYFSHFEAEKRVLTKKGYVWEKQKLRSQNHMFDCRLYNIVCVDLVLKSLSLTTELNSYQEFCLNLKKGNL